MARDHKGIIIEESLEDTRILNLLDVTGTRITTEDDPLDRLHIHSVRVSKDEIANLSKNVRQGWHMHFWKGNRTTVVFRNQCYEFGKDDRNGLNSAIKYGLFMGIPKDKLVFNRE